MIKLFTYLFIGIYLIALVSAVPKIVPYVNDYANILSPSEENNLNLLLDEIEKNTTYEIAIVTVENTEGLDRIEYTNRIGDENGVGKKDKDNGLVVLWSLDNEKGGAIATGRYSESIINDAKAGRIGRESRSLFDEEEYYEGFVFIINEINKEISNDNLNATNQSQGNSNDSFPNYLLIIGIGIIGFVIFNKLLLDDEDGSSSGSSYSSRGSSSSSGSSFGGGSFGGGGARF